MVKKVWLAAALVIGFAVHRSFLAERMIATFVTSDELSAESPEFRRYVIEHAAAIIAKPLPLGPLAWMVLDPDAEATAQSEPSDEKLRVLKTLAVFRTERNQQENELLALLHYARGPAILLLEQVNPMKDYISAEGVTPLHGYDIVSVPHDDHHCSKAAPHIVETLGSTALPLARSDTRLSTPLRELIPLLAREGLAPLADCYLRFRLSSSAVERTLCLFDCFEVLIKYSLLVMLSCRNECQTEDTFKALERPSLGTWGKLLQKQIERQEGDPNHLASEQVR